MICKAGMATFVVSGLQHSRRACGDVITTGHITVELRWIKHLYGMQSRTRVQLRVLSEHRR